MDREGEDDGGEHESRRVSSPRYVFRFLIFF
jgi:hypothetical protein